MNTYLHIECVFDGSRNMYLVIYLFGPIFFCWLAPNPNEACGLIFLPHSHCLFCKPPLLPSKYILLIENDTVEKVWAHQAKSFPVPGQSRAKNRL